MVNAKTYSSTLLHYRINHVKQKGIFSLSTASYIHSKYTQQRSTSSRYGKPTRKRVRKTVFHHFQELGPVYFKRAYRMSYQTFKQLYSILKPSLYQVLSFDDKNNCAPNGRILPSVRLACALRFLAGGDAVDIQVLYGISNTEVYESVKIVVEAVNRCESLKIVFPESHAEQMRIAKGFQEKSGANFSRCVGCIDGMLVWTYRPSKKDCMETEVGAQKYFCSRKNKYGLNLQAFCDDKLRFLDISIHYGGSSSDLLAFEASELRRKLEQNGFLAPNLCLFGDNAYINKMYMATPYPNVQGPCTKDSYNFFHSQLRIRIECAFGLLVQRWGFLRKKAPQQFTMKKVIATVSCLCRLHNFLINCEDEFPSQHTAEDDLHLNMNGAVPLVLRTGINGRNGQHFPDQLLGAGNHFDDDRTRNFRRSQQRSVDNLILPREAMLAEVHDQNLYRPSGN